MVDQLMDQLHIEVLVFPIFPDQRPTIFPRAP